MKRLLTIRLAVFLAASASGVATVGDRSLLARQLASRPAGDWITSLEQPDRVARLRIDYIIASLALKQGDVVADIGAGPGVLSLPIARAVSPGTVYAEDIDQALLDHIAMKVKEVGVSSVAPVLGTVTDPSLPAHDVDVALFHDVLHHIEDRAGFLKATVRYLKPTGRIAVIEMPPNGPHRAQPALVVTKDQVRTWMADAGFRSVREFDGLSDGKWFIVYARAQP